MFNAKSEGFGERFADRLDRCPLLLKSAHGIRIDNQVRYRTLRGSRVADINDFRNYTNTPARRHTFYCYCTQELVQDQAVFFMLVEAYRQRRLKRQAVFLNDWFILGNIPDELQDRGYLGIVNIADTAKNTVSQNATAAVNAVGKTFADKVRNHGGGARGIFGAVKQKLGDTKVDGELFNRPQEQVVSMLDETGKHGFGHIGGAGATYQPDGVYQPRGTFSHQVPIFRKYLKTVDFDPDNLGIY